MITQTYQRCIIPAYETLLKRRKLFGHLRELEESQWWSREQLESLQFERLRQLVEYCFRHSSYYRETWRAHGLNVEQLQSLDDYRRWPITRRRAMRDHAAAIRSSAPGLSVVPKATGGSSGAPLQFLIDNESNDRRIAASIRGYGWAGAVPGVRQSHLWGVAIGSPSLFKRWKNYLHARFLYRMDVLNSFELSDRTVPQYLKRLHRFRPEVLVAYTNPLYHFARAIEDRGLRPYHPRTIVVGAERLHGFQREVIERVFAAPVFETYGSREFTLIGAECEQRSGLHLTAEHLLVEVIDEDGLPVPNGEEGEVVITDLSNVAMPFVRYAIGDRAISGGDGCPCGRNLPMLQKVVGRKLDMLVTVDGRHLSGEFFPHLMKEYAAVRQFQVVQCKRDLVELKLVVDDRWAGNVRESLRREVQDALGDATRLKICEVSEIPLTRMGKWRVVIGYDDRARQLA